ncbi:hypothetical protein B0H11DRAFT_452370 [Mycena galericulata]|nr:hypothetical protein B0H11DRAFT_452370 [Mycena galericulata]
MSSSPNAEGSHGGGFANVGDDVRTERETESDGVMSNFPRVRDLGSMYNSGADPSGPVLSITSRLRTPIACTNCRRRKIKCNYAREPPESCERCVRRNLACTYEGLDPGLPSGEEKSGAAKVISNDLGFRPNATPISPRSSPFFAGASNFQITGGAFSDVGNAHTQRLEMPYFGTGAPVGSGMLSYDEFNNITAQDGVSSFGVKRASSYPPYLRPANRQEAATPDVTDEYSPTVSSLESWTSPSSHNATLPTPSPEALQVNLALSPDHDVRPVVTDESVPSSPLNEGQEETPIFSFNEPQISTFIIFMPESPITNDPTAIRPQDIYSLKNHAANGGNFCSTHRSVDAEYWVEQHHDSVLLKSMRSVGLGGPLATMVSPEMPALAIFGSILDDRVLELAQTLSDVSTFAVMVRPIEGNPVPRFTLEPTKQKFEIGSKTEDSDGDDEMDDESITSLSEPESTSGRESDDGKAYEEDPPTKGVFRLQGGASSQDRNI